MGGIDSRPFTTGINTKFHWTAILYAFFYSLTDLSTVPVPHITLQSLAQCSHTWRGWNVKKLHLWSLKGPLKYSMKNISTVCLLLPAGTCSCSSSKKCEWKKRTSDGDEQKFFLLILSHTSELLVWLQHLWHNDTDVHTSTCCSWIE